MAYLIQLTRKGTNFYGYRNYKGCWSSVKHPSFATTFKTEKGALRAIQKGDSLMLSAYGHACWHDRLQSEGYQVNVVKID
jgi:hypothetical protein